MILKRKEMLMAFWLVLALGIGVVVAGVPMYRASKSNEIKLQDVRHWHERDFAEVKTYLDQQKLNFIIKPSPTHIDDETEDCTAGSIMREWGEEKVPVDCYKTTRLRPSTFDAGFITRWKSSADGLEAFIQQDGWKKQYKDQTSLKALFDHSKDSASFLVFIKNHGATKCELGFHYNPPYPNLDDQTWMTNDCTYGH